MGGGKEAVEDDGSGTLAGSIRYTPCKARRISSLSGAVVGISSLSDSGPNTFRKTHRDGARCVTRLRQRALAKLDAPPTPYRFMRGSSLSLRSFGTRLGNCHEALRQRGVYPALALLNDVGQLMGK